MPKLSVIELCKRKTSVALIIDEDIVSTVINFKHQQIKEAFHNCTGVEDSGFGTYSPRKMPTIRAIEKMDNMLGSIKWKLSNRSTVELLEQLAYCEQTKAKLETKLEKLILDELKKYNRGLDKQLASKRTGLEESTGDSGTADGDLPEVPIPIE